MALTANFCVNCAERASPAQLLYICRWHRNGNGGYSWTVCVCLFVCISFYKWQTLMAHSTATPCVCVMCIQYTIQDAVRYRLWSFSTLLLLYAISVYNCSVRAVCLSFRPLFIGPRVQWPKKTQKKKKRAKKMWRERIKTERKYNSRKHSSIWCFCNKT